MTISQNYLPAIIDDPVAPMMERDYLAMARNHAAATLKHVAILNTSECVAHITTPFRTDDLIATYERLIGARKEH